MKYLYSICICLLAASGAYGQQNFWSWAEPATAALRQREIQPDAYRAAHLDQAKLAAWYDHVLRNQGGKARIELPGPDGRWHSFELEDAPIAGAALMSRYPGIHTFTLRNGAYQGRGDITPQGFHAILLGREGDTWLIDPMQRYGDTYQAYYKRDLAMAEDRAIVCEQDTEAAAMDNSWLDPHKNDNRKALTMGAGRSASIGLRTYRLALACTGEYASFHGGTVPSVLAAMITAMNRVNAIYERDLAIRMIIIDDNDQLIFLDAGSDPYDNNNGSRMLGQNQTTVNNIIGAQNYDIGHVFSTGGGGIAALGSVCTSSKARGVTGLNSPVGDPFYVDYVCHEIGHQFSGNHSFNNCSGNENPGTAFEPGSGTTIMAYAGLCGSNNVQFQSDDYFHVGSLQEMFNFSRAGAGNSCATIIPTGNTAPVVTIAHPQNLVIPVRTPFELTGSAVDTEDDTLYYNWEQYDLGPTVSLGNPTVDAPSFRSMPPTTDPTRVFPRIQDILSNASNAREVLPTYSRNLTFRLTARDYNAEAGGAAWAQLRMSATDQAGPFRVVAPTAGKVWETGRYEEIHWEVAGTDLAPVNCANVDILLSLDGGLTWTDTLAAGIPNNGFTVLLVPDIQTDRARIKVKGQDHVFFQVNPGNFRIQLPSRPGFTFKVDQFNRTLCLPTVLEIPFNTLALLDFDRDIHLDVDTTGLPGGIRFAFDASPVLPGETSTLSLALDASVPTGIYTIPVVFTAEDADTLYYYMELNTHRTIDGDPLAISPENGANGLSPLPIFIWEPLADATHYEIQISDNPAFPAANTITASGLTLPEYVPTATLERNTLYFWRVHAYNNCSELRSTLPNTFHTESLSCSDYTQTQEIIISPSGLPEYFSDITVPVEAEVSTVEVRSVIGSHQWFSDMEFALRSPDETEVMMVRRRCGGTNGSFSFGFSDFAPSAFACPPNTGALYQPTVALSNLQGKQAQGVWRLRFRDLQSGSGGRLNSWSLRICTNAPGSQPLLHLNELLVLKPGTQRDITSAELLTADPVVPASELHYTLASIPGKGELLLDGQVLQTGDSFTQEAIDQRRIHYRHTGEEEETDGFWFVVQQANGGWLDLTWFAIETDADYVSSIHRTELGDILVYPNPAGPVLHFRATGQQILQGIEIWSAEGRLLDRRQAASAVEYTCDISRLSPGWYIYRIHAGETVYTGRFLRQE